MSNQDRVVAIVMLALQRSREEVTDSAHFENDLGADSIDKIEIIMALEEEFSMEITDEEAQGINNVLDATKRVSRPKH